MPERGRVIGVPVTVGSLDSVADAIMRAAREGRGGYVCVANVHMATIARRNCGLAQVMECACIVSSDGMPLVWELRRQGYAAERVAGPDLMLRLCERAAVEGVPISLYGGSPASMESLVGVLEASYPALHLAGAETPPLLPAKPTFDIETARRIESSGARLVFVGLGCPKQEFWMATYAPHLAAVLVGVGAAFDFLSGRKRRAPLWMQERGLEWLFRLMTEPSRLWHRYLVTNALFLFYLIADRLRAAFSTVGKP